MKVLSIIQKLLVILTLLLGIVFGVPWTKTKIEHIEQIGDSILTQLNNLNLQIQLQNQLQAQIQAQAQEQIQKQKQGQAQKQIQTQSNVQQAEISPQIKTEVSPQFNIQSDTAKRSEDQNQSVEMDTLFPCNEWVSIHKTHAAEVRFDCFENSYDSVSVRVRLGYIDQQSILHKGEEKQFSLAFTYVNELTVFVHFKGFDTNKPSARVKYVDIKYIREK